MSGFPSAIWAAAPNDVWVVGNYNIAVHFDGTSWTTMEVSADTSHSVYGVWSDGATTWAVGEGEQIQKRSGGTWMSIQGAGGSSVGFLGVMGFGSDVWAVGQSFVHSTGGGPFMTETAPPIASQALWVTASQIWVAGGSGSSAVVSHRAR